MRPEVPVVDFKEWGDTSHEICITRVDERETGFRSLPSRQHGRWDEWNHPSLGLARRSSRI